MHDPLLEHIIALAEDETPVEAEVTLIVGGMLITGHVIGYEIYMAHHALTRAYLELDVGAEDELGADEIDEAVDNRDDGEDDEDFDDEGAFVHLRDTKVHAPGQTSSSGALGFYRVALGDVVGFSLAR